MLFNFWLAFSVTWQLCDSSDLFNAALGKPAFQKDSYSDGRYSASLAVDNNLDGNITNCSTTLSATGWLWWMVDLGSKHNIRVVQLYNRNAYSKSDTGEKLCL